MGMISMRGLGIRVWEDHVDEVSLICIHVVLAGERLWLPWSLDL